jgi:signal recognition particle subunit SRP19
MILWPEYFDKSLPKSSGRRVPKKLATNNPSVEEIARAAKRLKLLPKIELNKAYPSQWWRNTGRVIVSAKAKKTKIIRQIAIVMKKQKKR